MDHIVPSELFCLESHGRISLHAPSVQHIVPITLLVIVVVVDVGNLERGDVNVERMSSSAPQAPLLHRSNINIVVGGGPATERLSIEGAGATASIELVVNLAIWIVVQVDVTQIGQIVRVLEIHQRQSGRVAISRVGDHIQGHHVEVVCSTKVGGVVATVSGEQRVAASGGAASGEAGELHSEHASE